jgi:hypothetical protein
MRVRVAPRGTPYGRRAPTRRSPLPRGGAQDSAGRGPVGPPLSTSTPGPNRPSREAEGRAAAQIRNPQQIPRRLVVALRAADTAGRCCTSSSSPPAYAAGWRTRRKGPILSTYITHRQRDGITPCADHLRCRATSNRGLLRSAPRHSKATSRTCGKSMAVTRRHDAARRSATGVTGPT